MVKGVEHSLITNGQALGVARAAQDDRQLLGAQPRPGPAPAPLLRAENFYRYQVMIRTPQMSALSRKLSAKRVALQIPDDIRLIIDIDPMTLS